MLTSLIAKLSDETLLRILAIAGISEEGLFWLFIED